MSRAIAAVDSLDRGRTGISVALDRVNAAGALIEMTATSAAASGFFMVARAVQQVAEAVRGIHSLLEAARGSANEAYVAASEVSDEATPELVISALTRAMHHHEAAHRATMAAVGAVVDAAGLAQRVLQGADPGALIQTLGSINEVLLQLAQLTARQELTESISRAQKIAHH
ncbi:DUF6244 family protein [Micromonospora sonneratiae]|uniref:DUF6244 family protein n=1 Tax=Micromonospora sonneratiae TaxID=1184706 RepID=A0ABW3YNU7_9ACTN